MLFTHAGVGLLVLLAVHRLRSMCFIFKKIEASSWRKICQFLFGFNYIVLIYIIFKKSLNTVLEPFLQNKIRSLEGWEGLERNDGIH